MRKFAISDIHGAKATFLALLDKLAFSIYDELYLLGDYIDRGPDSKGVIDHIWKLQQEGYTIHCLRGNHEQMLIDSWEDPGRRGEIIYPNTLKSFGVHYPHHIDQPYIDWMKKLPYYLEEDGYIIVHAGLNFNVLNPLQDTTSMLWIRDTRAHIDRTWLRGRIVIHGHTPTPKEAILHYGENLDRTPQLVIDSGCVFRSRNPALGYLCAFELDTQELTFVECVDELG